MSDQFIRRVGVALGIATLFVFAFLAVFYAGHVLLVAFAGLLLAVYLRSIASFLGRWVPGKTRWIVTALLLVHVGALILFVWYVAPALEEQIRELSTKLPEAVNRIRAYLSEQPWGRPLVDLVPGHSNVEGEGTGSSRVVGMVSTGVSGLVDVVVILVVGIYGAVEPGAYRRGFLLLIPPRHRQRAAEVTDTSLETLRHFLLGLFASAAIIGGCSAFGLAIIGVPMPILLGLMAGVLTFIPNIGPIVSVVPPALLALLDSPRTALWVLVLYAGLQFLESYIVTPMIQRRAIALPPAMLILAQVLLGVLGGILGVALAAPLTALSLVVIRELYVKEPNDVPGLDPEDDDRIESQAPS